MNMKQVLFAVVVALSTFVTPAPASADVSFSITIAPPPLPVYEQPMLPGEDYIWMPGYWDYYDGDYYWVPGTWVRPPRVGFLWTPGYWMWDSGFFVFRGGYWGPHVGYYGGVNYGYGYGGYGYEGGRWDNGHFYYNRAVNNVNVTNVHNVYNQTVVNNVTVNRVSYNGGTGGINAPPRPEDKAAEHEEHVSATPEQTSHVQLARAKPELRHSTNGGRPPIAATPKPAVFDAPEVVPAKVPAEAQRDDTSGNAKAPEKQQRQAPATAPEQSKPQSWGGDEPRVSAPPAPSAKPDRQARPERPSRPEPRSKQEPSAAKPAPEVQPQEQRRAPVHDSAEGQSTQRPQKGQQQQPNDERGNQRRQDHGAAPESH